MQSTNVDLKHSLKRNYENEKSLSSPSKIDGKKDEEIYNLNQRIDDINKELALKVNIRDLCRMVDYKANIKYVDSIFESVKQSLASDENLKVKI